LEKVPEQLQVLQEQQLLVQAQQLVGADIQAMEEEEEKGGEEQIVEQVVES
jgi:hypothetical protein